MLLNEIINEVATDYLSGTSYNGSLLSRYIQDNIIDQSIDDKSWRSDNHTNVTSGLKSVILYKVTGTENTVIL